MAFVTFNSRRPLPSTGITLKNRIILPKSVDFPRVSASNYKYTQESKIRCNYKASSSLRVVPRVTHWAVVNHRYQYPITTLF